MKNEILPRKGTPGTWATDAWVIKGLPDRKFLREWVLDYIPYFSMEEDVEQVISVTLEWMGKARRKGVKFQGLDALGRDFEVGFYWVRLSETTYFLATVLVPRGPGRIFALPKVLPVTKDFFRLIRELALGREGVNFFDFERERVKRRLSFYLFRAGVSEPPEAVCEWLRGRRWGLRVRVEPGFFLIRRLGVLVFGTKLGWFESTDPNLLRLMEYGSEDLFGLLLSHFVGRAASRAETEEEKLSLLTFAMFTDEFARVCKRLGGPNGDPS